MEWEVWLVLSAFWDWKGVVVDESVINDLGVRERIVYEGWGVWGGGGGGGGRSGGVLGYARRMKQVWLSLYGG